MYNKESRGERSIGKINMKCRDFIVGTHTLEWGERKFNDLKDCMAEYLNLANDPDVELRRD